MLAGRRPSTTATTLDTGETSTLRSSPSGALEAVTDPPAPRRLARTLGTTDEHTQAHSERGRPLPSPLMTSSRWTSSARAWSSRRGVSAWPALRGPRSLGLTTDGANPTPQRACSVAPASTQVTPRARWAFSSRPNHIDRAQG